jgi:RNA polymerase sigma-70 factor (ECF subfamily)
VTLYDQLLALAPSPVVALNRAIAQSMGEGPAAALASLDELSAEPAMKNYYLLPAVRGDFLLRLGRGAEAAACFCEALSYPCTEPERRYLLRRLNAVKTDTPMLHHRSGYSAENPARKHDQGATDICKAD